ncbi:uncharacterized protein LOC107371979 [Tetranychus urticae]|uniref:Uncharacterized protein n=1 Tax=Tetranychus urticae TaxID=32264 RepID=T1JZM2_TETUR|nr:uncharacterized protein LOC107371979 [Tetranychus urticae]
MSLKHLIIVSLCLLTIAINARAAPGDPNEVEPKEDGATKPPTTPEPETKPEPEPEPEKVQLIKTSDSSVIIRLLIDPKSGEKKFKKFSLVYALERPNEKGDKEWRYSDKDATVNVAKIKNKVIKRGVVGKVFQYDIEVTNIQPDTKIKILFDLFYDEEKVRTKEIETRTKAKSPVIKTTAQLLTLQFENPNAVKYFAKVNKMKDDKETDCVLELTMSPCFGNSIGLPGLISGEKYSIKVWYIQADNSESEVTTQVITGLQGV